MCLNLPLLCQNIKTLDSATKLSNEQYMFTCPKPHT